MVRSSQLFVRGKRYFLKSGKAATQLSREGSYEGRGASPQVALCRTCWESSPSSSMKHGKGRADYQGLLRQQRCSVAPQKVAFIILSDCSNKLSAGSRVALLQPLLLMLVSSRGGSLPAAATSLWERVGACSVISWW